MRARVPLWLAAFGCLVVVCVNSRPHAQQPRGGLATSPHNFVPDVRFTGSTLTGWRAVGQAAWSAENGEIVAAPKPGGWLMLDRSYQDVAISASFRCAAACTAGVIVRAEKTADGGMKGVFVNLAEGDLASYRVTLDGSGHETSRTPLRGPGGGQLRVAPAPDPAPPAPAARGAGPAGPPSMPAGVTSPIPPPMTTLRAGDWNTIEVVLDANILRAFLNDNVGIRDGVVEPEYSYGQIALYAGGAGEVRFRDVAYKDLQPRTALPEKVSPHFRMQVLNELYYSWGPAVADFNHDGSPDIVSGPYYYLGPSYNEARQIYVGGTIDPSTQYFNGLQYAYDFTGDGWPDVLNSIFQRQAILYVNPKGESRRWEMYPVTDTMTCEFMLLRDVDGDGKPEFIFKDSENKFVFAKPDPANPTAMWIKHAISEPGPWANHGMGVGDVNGDGHADFLNAYGWWEQPATGAQSQRWTYHPAAFGRWTRARAPGGADMACTMSTATDSTTWSRACRRTDGVCRGSSRRRRATAAGHSSSIPSWETSRRPTPAT